MVHTIHTRSIRRGRGREYRTRRTPHGLGPNRGSIDSHRPSTRHVSRSQSRSNSLAHTGEVSSREPIRRRTTPEPSVDYTPRTPTREDIMETIEALRGENTRLRERLTQSPQGLCSLHHVLTCRGARCLVHRRLGCGPSPDGLSR